MSYFVLTVLAVLASVADLAGGVAALVQAGEDLRRHVALPRQRRLRDRHKIRENQNLVECEGPVGVHPVVHGGVVGHLVRLGPLPVRKEHAVDVSLLILEGVQALQYRRLRDRVLALRREQGRAHR